MIEGCHVPRIRGDKNARLDGLEPLGDISTLPYGILFHIESTLLQVCSAILKEFINWHLSYERDTSNEFPDCISCRADTFQNIGFYC